MCMAQMYSDHIAKRKCACPFCNAQLDGAYGVQRLEKLKVQSDHVQLV